jgi:hypothetical protein
MSPLRERMIEDMILAGLALGTRQAYTQAVRRLAARYRRSPDQLNGEEIAATCSSCANRGQRAERSRLACTASASSTSTHSVVVGICSGKKGSSCLGRSGCLMRCRMIRSGNCSATSATRSPGRASPPSMQPLKPRH